MNFIKKNLSKLYTILFFFLLPAMSFADGTNTSPNDVKTIVNPIHASTINGFIKDVLVGVIKIGMPVIALALIYSGFLFVSARGNSEKLNTAKQALLYTVIGAAILLGSWALAQLISDTVLAL